MSKAEVETAKVRIDLRKNRIYPITPLPDKPDGRSRMPVENPVTVTIESDTEEASSSARATVAKNATSTPKQISGKKRRVSDGAVRKIDNWFTPKGGVKRKAKAEESRNNVNAEVEATDSCAEQSTRGDRTEDERHPKASFKARIFDCAPVPLLHFIPSCSPVIPDSPESMPALRMIDDVDGLPSKFHKLFLRSDEARKGSECIELSYIDEWEMWKYYKKMSTMSRIYATRAQVQERQNVPWNILIQPKSAENLAWNENALKTIQSWLTDWKKVQLRQQTQTESENTKRRGKREKVDSESDDAVEDEDADYILSRTEMIESYENPLCIVGARGYGKTTLLNVATAAEGYSAIERGVDSDRSQQNLLKLKEATCSHRMTTDIRKLFNKSNKISKPTESVSRQKAATMKKRKEFSVLVFEDVDLEDESFWGPLKQLLTDSKIPIVLTCVEVSVVEGRFENPKIIGLEQPDINLQTEYLEASLFGLAHTRIPKDFVKECLKAFDGDFRRCLNQLQVALSDKPSVISLQDVTGDHSDREDAEDDLSQLRFEHPWQKQNAASRVSRSEGESSLENACRTRTRRRREFPF
ncbi:hypothetical protein QR680_017375 [Steinernema hermaphroditum]|uniref:ATPase AAA-type core domain-containing protein n=1 Tax=Steinernema hermaphroditum TaxID=289476 RepID=A0AA39LP61_9BILA|nr:hypothetical protein QR680_017375 [Steinernema hermaphroditum]